MLKENNMAYGSQLYSHRHQLCWSAIFAGALVGLGLGFLLNLFGVAIGLTAFTLDEQGAGALAVGGFIGFVITVIVSMAIAGYTAGYLGRHFVPKRNLGLVYGFTTWSVSLLLSAIVASHVSQYVIMYTNNVAPAAVTMVPEEASSAGTISVQQNANTINQNTTKANRSSMMNVNASPSGLALSAFIVFAMFFIGAISACFGAHCAFHCRRDEDGHCITQNKM